jgi:hypothetical protein
VRADFGFVGLDHRVECGGIDVAFLGEHRLQRAHAQLHFGEFRAIPVLVVVVVVVGVIVRHRAHSVSVFRDGAL